ncbi:uncharacterized protein EV422DRAFT_498416 [Fimicolochytrium jonesii]|uniref:uncharacterized protein n=1 Tax=Fimicolochytrium jonesii TaxID=1396493 RepID=UPI0022FE1FFE|nr:uncharacterized protein EV422DRAFT_498416 [Fimicolochytrium jonesii]KAI8819033.1 hypothetical protein EV422DRAFT_498416 [Fimicolochytrium jonesii]
MSPTSSSASRDGDRYQRDRERDRLREREREREREKEREKDRLLREQLSGATSRSTQRSARDTPSEDASRTRSTKASWRNRGQDAAPTSASTTSPTTRTAASTQDSTAATPQPADSPRTAAAERADAREIERQRREQERVDAERKDADLREAQMIQKARTEVTAADKQLERVVAQQRVHRIDEKLVVPDYVEGVRLTLASDRNSYPEPEDFTSSDGYGLWEQNIGGTFSDVLSDMLKARFLDKRPRIEDTPEPSRSKGKQPENSYDVQLFFKVIEARGLVAKEGRTRDAYCDIEHGRIPDDGTDEARRADKGRKDRPVMQTETVRGSLNPRWDQHVNLQCDHPADKIMVSVFDRAKEQFLGRIKVSFGELIDAARRKSPVTRWYPLNGLGKKEKDKYVGGEILIEAAIKDDPNAPSQRGGSSSSSSSRPARQQDPFAQLLSQITYTTVDFRAMYKVLLRACLVLDMNMLGNSITELTVELLSPESMSMLGILGRAWGLTEAFMAMAYLELLFRRYKNAEVPQGALVGTLEGLKTSMKDDPKWLSHRERPALVTLLNEMEAYYRTQIQKYRDFFPKNTPKDALETTIMMLRMIVKHPVFRESPRNPPLTNSFQDYIKPLLTEAAIERYQQLSELCKPLDENDVEGVVEGVTKLGELISEEIDADAKYFFTAFKRELDIVRHTTEIYLKYYVLTLESTTETISSDAAVTSGSKMVFELYRQVKVMDERYAKIAPGLKRMSANTGFNVERWFAPFITRWLEHLSTKTVEWVNNAVKADQFEPLNPNDGGFSSSVTDLFSAVYQELEFIKGLEWSDPVQSAGFMQGFAKTVSKAIENYCDALAMGEIKADASTGSSWQGLLATTVGKTAQNGPKDIANVSCVKLCNIEYAMTKLHDMFRVMNVQELNRILRRHRAQVAAEAEALSASSPSSAKRAEEDDTCVSGALKVHLSYAENLQPCNKNGLANPYIILRVPDGTVVPPPETSATPAAASSTGGRTTPFTGSSSANPPVGPTILNGIACELARSRAIPDTLAPTWDETFEVMLPPVTKLEVAVLSKNILTADDFAGNAVVNLAKGTRLRRKLADHQAHDVYVDLEPQGRVLVRLTMEGAAEDVEFWFRRSKERLGRMRDDFVRSLTARIIPYAKEEIIRVIKAQEAVPLPSKSFFSSLTTATQYSNLTAAGVPIDEPVTVRDIDDALEPLIEYLNKNLATLDVYLSERMSQEVIRRCWDEIVAVVENTLIPPLYGPVERDRRILNLRQTSASLALLNTLLEFFHAGGDGVPMEQLETRRFKHAKALVGEHVYHADVARLKKEYEHQLLKGRDRELIIRLIRVKVEKNDGTLTAQEVEETKQWIEAQLLRRKEFVRRT